MIHKNEYTGANTTVERRQNVEPNENTEFGKAMQKVEMTMGLLITLGQILFVARWMESDMQKEEISRLGRKVVGWSEKIDNTKGDRYKRDL